MRCLVLTDSRSGGIGDGLTYESGDLDVKPGQLVTVPLRGKPVEGIVLSVGDPPKQEEVFALKKILKIAHPSPLLTRTQMGLLRWVASYYHCTLRQAIRVFLPPPPWRGLLPREIVEYRPAGDSSAQPRGTKQKDILASVRESGVLPEDHLLYHLGAPRKTLATLVEQGYLTQSKRWAEARPAQEAPQMEDPVLTPAQEAAYREIVDARKPVLLFGITGSGKTEIYARLIADAVRAGGQALLLVPEILLTAQSVDRFERLLGRERIAVLHSKLTEASRRTEWRRIREGGVHLVIGSRSALFAPLPSLKLILLDEEHEWTYKNEQTPRYHARETSEMLAGLLGAKLAYGTATPSMESWHRAKEGRYALVRLAERYKNRPIPAVRIVDLAGIQFGSLYPFSPPLLDAVKARLDKGEQTVLFLNRRGMASALLCMGCRRSVLSPESQLPYTLHRTQDGRPFLMDHITGEAIAVPAGCPACGAPSLRAVGAGTQRLEDLLAAVFPKARVLRADGDTLRDPAQMRRLLRTMLDREADILLGTQAVVKGLDLPGVTLAAVMVADIGLSLPHFRSGERVFQLLTQLAGRSGRTIPGEVIIQTFRPDAAEIAAAAAHRTEAYLEEEMTLRRGANYPPLTPMIRIIVAEPDARARAQKLLSRLREAVSRGKLSAVVTAAPTFFGGGKIWHLLLRGKDVRALLPSLEGEQVMIDVDPMDTL